jgi:hypothetical protein
MDKLHQIFMRLSLTFMCNKSYLVPLQTRENEQRFPVFSTILLFVEASGASTNDCEGKFVQIQVDGCSSFRGIPRVSDSFDVFYSLRG